MRRLWRWLFGLSLARRAQRRRDERAERGRAAARGASSPERRVAVGSPGAEVVVAALLLGAGAGGAAFAVLIAVHPNTQLLGLALGLALLCLAAAAILAAKRVVPQETIEEERPELGDEDESAEVDGLVKAGGDGISRRRLIAGAAGAAGVGLGAAAAAPISALGPNVSQRIDRTPWRSGRLVVDEEGRPILADDVVGRTLVTGFPQDARRRELGSPIVLVRLDLSALDLPAGREDWAPEGIVAYSKICTHAGCAISLYRKPTYRPVQPRPALVCPCHYSTFDPARGAAVIFGPAGRPLPQLPLRIGPGRRLEAAGGFSGSVGPAWLNVERGS